MDEEISFNINFVKGEDLLPADVGGKSDPYVSIIKEQAGLVIPKEHKTSWKKDTLSPVWNQSFDIRRLRRGTDLKIECFDHDYIGKDDFLGTASIPLDFLDTLGNQVSEFWVKLFHIEKDDLTKKKVPKEKGRILVRIRLNPKFLPGNWIPINLRKAYVGLGWDFVSKNEVFDLDSSVAGFDAQLNCIDYAYYGKLEAFNGNIKHKGDDTTGEGSGDDEVIRINLDKIPFNVMYLAVVINSYRKNSMIKAKSAFIRLFDQNKEYGKYVLTRTKDCIGLLFGLFSRRPNSAEWFFRVMADPLEGNTITNSLPSLKGILSGYSLDGSKNKDTVYKSNVSKHPLPGEALFTKGKWIPLVNSITNVGLGWDFMPGETYDLDASAIIMDGMGRVLDIVFHEHLMSSDGTIKHLGDNKLGFGEGDDEIITLNLPQVHPCVSSIAIVVNSFKGNSLIGVRNGFIRIFDQLNRPIGCQMIGQFVDCVGLLLGLFRRNQKGEWIFQVMIDPIRGVKAVESINDVLYLLRMYPLPPQDLQEAQGAQGAQGVQSAQVPVAQP